MENKIHFKVPMQMSASQSAFIERCRHLHPSWEIVVWQDPIEQENFLLREYYSKVNSGAQLADLIRLDVVYECGGIYLDSDIELIKPLDPLLEMDNLFCSEDGWNLTNAVFGATRHSPLIKKIIDYLLHNEPDWSLPPNETTGPKLFSKVLQWANAVNLLPRDTFYPYNWNESERAPKLWSYGVHRWEGSWKCGKRTSSAIKRGGKAHFFKQTIINFIDKIMYRGARLVENQIKGLPGGYTYGKDMIVKTTRGIKMSLPGSDLSVTPEIALTGTYEEKKLRFVETTLKGGDFFVDVGCNVGIFALVAARRVGPFGRVIAYDPNPEILVHLERSLVMNWFHDRVCVQYKALGSKNKKTTLELSEYSLGGATIGLDEASVFQNTVDLLGARKRIHITAGKLDDEFRTPFEIKILKVDVEGHEHEVLAGAAKLIENQCINYIMIELIEEVSSNLHKKNVEAVRWVLGNGYEPYALTQEGALLRHPSWPSSGALGRNIVLVRTN